MNMKSLKNREDVTSLIIIKVYHEAVDELSLALFLKSNELQAQYSY